MLLAAAAAEDAGLEFAGLGEAAVFKVAKYERGGEKKKEKKKLGTRL